MRFFSTGRAHIWSNQPKNTQTVNKVNVPWNWSKWMEVDPEEQSLQKMKHTARQLNRRKQLINLGTKQNEGKKNLAEIKGVKQATVSDSIM